ncbi:hypothetical protein HMPREF2086_01739 [Helicobacter macacae MIT 99-5501]|uniref:Uncharacterized protein n=2 Tax=Helicobacter TaxID=209 RepID=V8C6D1_9HELI|nr:hypothetical protein HMPREF2086_01739 [Helicobacter macacae MIT 99-5501]
MPFSMLFVILYNSLRYFAYAQYDKCGGANVKAKSKCGFASKRKSGLQANANVGRKYKVLHSAIYLAQAEVSKKITLNG